jgi:hypothetical protein
MKRLPGIRELVTHLEIEESEKIGSESLPPVTHSPWRLVSVSDSLPLETQLASDSPGS